MHALPWWLYILIPAVVALVLHARERWPHRRPPVVEHFRLSAIPDTDEVALVLITGKKRHPYLMDRATAAILVAHLRMTLEE